MDFIFNREASKLIRNLADKERRKPEAVLKKALELYAWYNEQTGGNGDHGQVLYMKESSKREIAKFLNSLPQEQRSKLTEIFYFQMGNSRSENPDERIYHARTIKANQ